MLSSSRHAGCCTHCNLLLQYSCRQTHPPAAVSAQLQLLFAQLVSGPAPAAGPSCRCYPCAAVSGCHSTAQRSIAGFLSRQWFLCQLLHDVQFRCKYCLGICIIHITQTDHSKDGNALLSCWNGFCKPCQLVRRGYSDLSSVQKQSCSLSCVLPLLSRQLRPSRASSCTCRSCW